MTCFSIVDNSATFNAAFTPALLDDAARVFVRRYLVGPYGALLVAATAIDIAGLSLALWLGATSVSVAPLGALVLLGAFYFIFTYFRLPLRISERMQRILVPTTGFSIDAERVVVTTAEKRALFEWSRIKSVLEFEPYFLLVLSPFAFLVVPKSSLPAEPATLLLGRVTKRYI